MQGRTILAQSIKSTDRLFETATTRYNLHARQSGKTDSRIEQTINEIRSAREYLRFAMLPFQDSDSALPEEVISLAENVHKQSLKLDETISAYLKETWNPPRFPLTITVREPESPQEQTPVIDKKKKEAERKKHQREMEKMHQSGDFRRVFWNDGKINPPESFNSNDPMHIMREKNGEEIYTYKYYKMKRNKLEKMAKIAKIVDPAGNPVKSEHDFSKARIQQSAEKAGNAFKKMISEPFFQTPETEKDPGDENSARPGSRPYWHPDESKF